MKTLICGILVGLNGVGFLGLTAQAQSQMQIQAGTSTAQKSKTASQPSARNWIWVVRDDGTKSCEGTPTNSLKDARAELEKAGVKVKSARRGHDGLMHLQMCGASTGDQNEFEIAKKDLKIAEKRGFKLPGSPAELKKSGTGAKKSGRADVGGP